MRDTINHIFMGGLGRNLLKFLTFLTVRVSWRGAANCDAMEEENI